jgi:hypothetical protein
MTYNRKIGYFVKDFDEIRAMNFFNKLFNKPKQPEDYFKITITDEFVKLEHPRLQAGLVQWKEIHTILLVNTDQGPWQPDVWLALISENGSCIIPQGANGYEKVYEIVSKFEGFNFSNVIKSMTCVDNAKFVLWTNKIVV